MSTVVLLEKKQIFHINVHVNNGSGPSICALIHLGKRLTVQANSVQFQTNTTQRETCCPGHVVREKPVGAASKRQSEDEST